MAHAPLPVLEPRRFGETLRRDAWWLPNVPTVIILTGFVVYATWAAFQNTAYTHGPYLSPFYSPELFGASPHAWFGPQPGWWPSWLPFSPALIILPVPALFRFTCYYYRGAYYRAFWADPPGCAVGEPRKSYRGERSFPLVLQNVHRYGLLLSVIFLFILTYDTWKGFWFVDPATGTEQFGIGTGSLLMTFNVLMLAGYTFGCHATRHVVGGLLDRISGSRLRRFSYDLSTRLNISHMRWAWVSLFTVALTDLYIRLCAMGVLHDARLL